MWAVADWMRDGILEIKDDYKELKEIQARPPANLWDVFRFNVMREDVLPFMKKRIMKYQRDLHNLLCTSKAVYINGCPKIENNL